MTAYISVSFSNRKQADRELAAITATLYEFSIAPFIFIDHYRFSLSQEQQMMRQAMADIDNCGLLIAAASYKAIGIGVEAGYAKAKGKPVIYIRQQEAEHSTTVSGISDYHIIYLDASDLRKQLVDILIKIV